jgi:polyisoprenyl-phosphate glycosyltransferase
MSIGTATKLVVVTPVYEDVEASSRLFAELRVAQGEGVFVVAVDDGSVRQPVGTEGLEAAGVSGVVVRLRRNVGHQRAIAIGLGYVAEQLPDAERIVVMDSDGEDLPQTIDQLAAPLVADDVDIVVAQRRSRVETLRFRAFYVVYKWLFKLLSGRTISFGNFMAMKPAALRRLTAMQELWIHVAGCVLTSKLRVATCPLDRGPRYAGQSKMNFVGLALHGFRGLMVFAEDVLVRVGIACTLVAALSIAGSAAAIVLKVLGFATPGWFSVALGILLLVFLQTGALTLMTLMLTGVVRGGSVARIEYRDFVETVLHAGPGRSR